MTEVICLMVSMGFIPYNIYTRFRNSQPHLANTLLLLIIYCFCCSWQDGRLSGKLKAIMFIKDLNPLFEVFSLDLANKTFVVVT